MPDGSMDRGQSLRVQLLRWLIPPVLAVIALSSLVSYALALKFASDAYDIGLYDEARSLAEQVRFAKGRATLDLPPAAEQMVLSDPFDRIYFRVFLPTGETIAGRSDVPGPAITLSPEEPVYYYDATIDAHRVRVGAFALFGDDGAATATAVVAETLIKRARLSRSVMLTVLIPLVTLSLLVASILWYGIRRGLLPLQRVAGTVAMRGWNDLSSIGVHGIPLEARPLTHAIDDLMRRLDTALAAQQRFISEAAHELRTPLAGVSAQTERALLGGDMQTIKSALAQLQIAAQRATRLVNQLLALARAEPGGAAAHQLRRLDLAALVRRVCMERVPEALAKSVDLGYAGESGVLIVDGDEHLLEDMLNNLIDNALRYGARPGGRVTVSLQCAPHPVVSVEDDGQGIPEDERSRIFERFHRIPGSAPGGSGLGLAIVREIAHAHGAEVSVESRYPGGGTVFRVAFGSAAGSQPPRGERS